MKLIRAIKRNLDVLVTMILVGMAITLVVAYALLLSQVSLG